MSETTFAAGDRVWVSAEGTDGGDAGYATLIAIRENGTCDLRDDNGAEYWSLLSHLTPTQPPAPTGATARTVIHKAIRDYIDGNPFFLNTVEREVDVILSALAEAGYVTFGPDEVATITRALRAEARGIGSYPVACLEILQRLAARQPEGVSE